MAAKTLSCGGVECRPICQKKGLSFAAQVTPRCILRHLTHDFTSDVVFLLQTSGESFARSLTFSTLLP